jgi:uncharacterized protein YbcI
LLENIQIQKIESLGKNGKSHLKIHGKFWDKKVNIMFRGKWSEAEELIKSNKSTANIVGRVRKDTFNGGYFLDWADIK